MISIPAAAEERRGGNSTVLFQRREAPLVRKRIGALGQLRSLAQAASRHRAWLCGTRSGCRFPFNLSLLCFQLAQLTLSSCDQLLAWLASGYCTIDLLLGRDLEDAGRSSVYEQVEADGLGLLTDGQFSRLGQQAGDLAGQPAAVDHELLNHGLIAERRRLVQRKQPPEAHDEFPQRGTLVPPRQRERLESRCNLGVSSVRWWTPSSAPVRQLSRCHGWTLTLQVERAEVTDRAVRGEVACCQHPERHILVQLARDLA